MRETPFGERLSIVNLERALGVGTLETSRVVSVWVYGKKL